MDTNYHRQIPGYELIQFRNLKPGQQFRFRDEGHDYRSLAFKGSNIIYVQHGYSVLLSRSIYSPVWVYVKI